MRSRGRGAAGVVLEAGRREVGAEVEEIVLHPLQRRRRRRPRACEPRQPEGGVELVDRAVGGDPQRRLRHPGAVAERGLAGVAGARIDAVQHHHRLSLRARKIDVGHDQQDGHELQQQPQAHDPVGVLAVELAAAGEAADPDQQHRDHRQAGDGDDDGSSGSWSHGGALVGLRYAPSPLRAQCKTAELPCSFDGESPEDRITATVIGETTEFAQDESAGGNRGRGGSIDMMSGSLAKGRLSGGLGYEAGRALGHSRCVWHAAIDDARRAAPFAAGWRLDVRRRCRLPRRAGFGRSPTTVATIIRPASGRTQQRVRRVVSVGSMTDASALQ